MLLGFGQAHKVWIQLSALIQNVETHDDAGAPQNYVRFTPFRI